MDTFGKRLRAARREVFERGGKDLSQVELSLAIGMTKAAVSAYEADSYLPPIETVEKLARELGVNPGWLAFGRGPRYEIEPGETSAAPPMPYQKAAARGEGSKRKRAARKPGRKKGRG